MDNNWAVVGAPLEDTTDGVNAITDSGLVHVFKRSSGNWNSELTPSYTGAARDDEIGASVAVSGGTVVFGVPKYDHEVSNNPADDLVDIGRFFVYLDPPGSALGWGTPHDARGGSAGDWFGTSVAIDGGTAIVGAPVVQVGAHQFAGKAYVHTENSNGSWSRKATLDADTNAGLGYAFGTAVAVDGSTAVVGAFGDDSGKGAVYVFTRNGNAWPRAARLTAPNAANDDSFGRSVAVDGDFVVVGSWRDDDGGTNSGSVFVFTKPSGGWGAWSSLSSTEKSALTAKLTASDAAAEDHFGWSVAVDGDNVVVGAYGNDDDGADSGSAYLFTKPNGGWATATETVKLTAPDGAADDEFGYSVAAGGDRAIVGAPGDESYKGAAYVFGIAWTDISVSDDGATISHTATGLANGVEHTFLIRPVVGSNPGPTSGTTKATPQQSPAATPTGLSALGRDAQVTLSWNDPNDSTIIGYKFQQKEGSGTFGSWMTIPTSGYGQAYTTGYTVTGLDNGKTYTFRIRAVDEAGDSNASNQDSASTLPAALVNLVAAASDGQVTLSWDDPGNNSITKYQYSTDGGTNFADIGGSGATTTTYTVTVLSDGTDTALVNGSTYTFTVRAVNNTGNGGAATLTVAMVPPAPTGLMATASDGQVTLSWSDPGNASITKYQYSTDGGTNYSDITLNVIDSSETGKFKYTIKGLPNGVTYNLALRAVNASGNGGVATATALMVPAAPVNLTATPLDKQVQLTWDDPAHTTKTKYELLQLAEESGLIASDAAKNDRFGVSVAVDDDTAVVGAFQPDYLDSGTNVSRPGAAYVYTKDSNGAWSQQAKLTASDGADGDEFGISVAVDGDTVVVGARGNVSKTGAIYVFTKPSDGNWTSTITETKLTATGGAADDLFGASVALYGESAIVVGAPGDQNSVGGTDVSTGSAYVFTRNSETGEWSQNAKLTATDAQTGDEFGISVAVDDDTIAVGAYGKDGNSIADSGLVYVFVKSGGAAWATTTETVQLRASDRAANDNFGRSVAVDTDTIVVGASGDRNTVGGTEVSTGSAYVFTRPDNGWTNSAGTETAKLTASDAAHTDQFGRSVAVYGDTIVVGAHQNDDDGTDSGSIYVFIKPTNGWTDITGTVKLTASNGEAGDRFGIALALDGDTALVAAPRNDANDDDGDTGNDVLDAGSAYVFEIKGWTDVPEDDAMIRFHAVTGLTNFYTYTFALRAVNASGDGPASAATDTPMPVPAAPVILSATPGDGQVALTWDDPEDDTITKYQYSTDYIINGGGNGNNGGASFTEIPDSDGSTTEYTVDGLANGTTHTLAVRAVNTYGNGMTSAVTALMIPVAPKLSAAPGNGQVVLSWDDPDNLTISEYQLSQSDPPEWSRITGSNATTTTHTVTGLTNYTGHSFQIRAVNETGAGPASNSASATPRLPKPAKPAGLSAQAGDVAVNLSWDNPGPDSTIDKYQISEAVPEAWLTAGDDAAAGQQFGVSVAVDGNTAVIGAWEKDNGNGAAYAFTRDDADDDWTEAAKLTASDGADDDRFGYAVAVDGDTIVVGAYRNDDNGDDSGSAYVFVKPFGGWTDGTETVKLTAPDRVTESDGTDDLFGLSVAVDVDAVNDVETVVVGAPFQNYEPEDSEKDTLNFVGSVYVFTKSDLGWTDTNNIGSAKLNAPIDERLPGSLFGSSVAVDGDTILIGSYPSWDRNFVPIRLSRAYIYTKPDGGWVDSSFYTSRLTPSDASLGDWFAYSVALDGDTAAIGARLHNDPRTGAGSGAAYVFVKESGAWGEKAKLTASDAAAGDNFGVSVAVEDDTVVVGSWQDDDNGRNSGSAYVFTKPALGWAGTLETLKLTAPNGAANDRFGWSVAVDLDDHRVDLALVGAYSDDIGTGIDAGSVHVLGIPNWVDIDDSDDATTSHTVAKELDDPDTDLSNGTEYAFQVRALNRSGAGPASDAANATPLGVPDAPDLTASAGDGQVTLSWTKHVPTDPITIAPITGYKLSKNDGATFANIDNSDIDDSDATDLAYTVTGLGNLTTYTFQILVVNAIGGTASNRSSAMPESGTPAAPILTAVAGDTQVRLTWDDPNDSSIDKYQYSTDGGTNFKDIPGSGASTTGHTVTGLTNDVLYTLKVRAVDDQAVEPEGPPGEGNATPMGTPPNKPDMQTPITRNHRVTLTWGDPDDSTIDKYQYQQLQADEVGDFSDWGDVWVDIVLGDIENIDENTIGYTVSNLTNGERYRFRIRAVDLVAPGTDDDEFSNPSGDAEAIPLPDRPRAPTNLNVTARNQEVTLTWRAPLGPVVDKYEVLHLQASELAAPNVAKDDKFGYSVAVDGDIAVVGAYRNDDNGADSGAAYVFTRSTGVVWDEGVKLTASDGDSYDNFGISVAVDGEAIVIGASGDDDNGADSGSVYVFTRDPDSGVWSQAAKLTASEGEALDYFGQSVAVSGDTVLVGAPFDDREETDTETGLEDSGTVYVFTKANGVWSQAAELTASDAADDDNFGASVALDGDTAVIGAPGDDDGIDSGSVYVFVKPGSDDGWADENYSGNETAKLTASGAADDDNFGTSVALDNVTALIGAPGDDDNGIDSGSAYVFTKDSETGTWSETNKLTHENGQAGDWFGYSVAVDTVADTALVGAGSAHVMDIHDWEEVEGGVGARSYTFTELTNGREYDFQVRAVNLASAGLPAEEDAIPGTESVPPVVAPPIIEIPPDDPDNGNPSFVAVGVILTVAENTPEGGNVGEVAATDPDNDAPTYSLSGADASYFEIGLATGQITVGPGTELDYESGVKSYEVIVSVRDGKDSSDNADSAIDDSITVTVNVTDVDEPPSQPGAPLVSAEGLTGLTVGWTAPDNQGPEITGYDLQYREPGGTFRDAAYSGIGTSMTLQGLRPGAGYEVQVRAVNAEGSSPWSESGQGETGEALPTLTPTPVPTATPMPMPTPEPTSTPVPAPTVTLAPSPASTVAPVPVPTATPAIEAATKTVPLLPTSSPERAGTDPPTRTLRPAATLTTVPTATLVFTPQPDRTSTPVAIGALTTAPTPTMEPAPPQADSAGDGGFPWWVILLVLIGAIIALLLFAWTRRRRDRAARRS